MLCPSDCNVLAKDGMDGTIAAYTSTTASNSESKSVTTTANIHENKSKQLHIVAESRCVVSIQTQRTQATHNLQHPKNVRSDIKELLKRLVLVILLQELGRTTGRPMTTLVPLRCRSMQQRRLRASHLCKRRLHNLRRKSLA